MAATRIVVTNNGSLGIEGDFEIVDAAGGAFGLGGRQKVSLCRCGQSDTKPFCDGTHRRCGFQSTVVAHNLPAQAPPRPASG